MVKTIYLSFLFTFISSILFAQNAISLSKAIEMGLDNNFDLHISELKQNIAQKNKEIGVPERFPAIQFRLQQRNRFSFDNSPTSFVEGLYSQSDVSGSVDLEWILFDGFQVRINRHQLAHLEEQSNGLSQLVIENSIVAIVLAYYKALIEKEKLELVRELQSYSFQKFKKAKTELQYGDISLYDLYNIENALIQDSINQQLQAIVYDQSLIELKFILGINKSKKIKLTDKLEFKAKNYKLKSLQMQMLTSNQDLKNQYTNLLLQQNTFRLMRAQRKPSLKLLSGISEELSTSKFQGDERDNGGVFDYYLNFSLSYTIFDGAKLKRRIQEAKIEENIAQLQIDQLKQKITEKLQLSFEKYDGYKKIMHLQERLIENLKKNTEIVRDRFDNGYSLFLEYRSIQTQLLESKFKLLETILALKTAEIEMIRLRGGITRVKKF